MRAWEVCGLKIGNVRPKFAILPDTKNGTVRQVPLSLAAQAILAGKNEGERIFGLSSQQLSVHFRKVRDKIGADWRFHDIRHTAATRIAMSGNLTPFELCKMFGWKDMNMALRYFNASASDIADRL